MKIDTDNKRALENRLRWCQRMISLSFRSNALVDDRKKQYLIDEIVSLKKRIHKIKQFNWLAQ